MDVRVDVIINLLSSTMYSKATNTENMGLFKKLFPRIPFKIHLHYITVL